MKIVQPITKQMTCRKMVESFPRGEGNHCMKDLSREKFGFHVLVILLIRAPEKTT